MADGEKSACVSSRPKFILPLTAQVSGSIYMSEWDIKDRTKRRISPLPQQTHEDGVAGQGAAVCWKPRVAVVLRCECTSHTFPPSFPLNCNEKATYFQHSSSPLPSSASPSESMCGICIPVS